MFFRSSALVAFALTATACSDDGTNSGPGGSVTSTNPNQPSANGGSSGGTGMGAAGSGSPTASAGGSGSEATPAPMLNQGGGMAMGGGNMTAGAAGMAPVEGDAAVASGMSFFLTSRGTGNGGDFGGIAGADAFCTMLAVAADPANGNKTWRAYLSTSTENARARIGTGPWRNAAGAIIANDVDQLHAQTPGAMGPSGAASETNYPVNDINTALNEFGDPLPAQPVLHDIVTGSTLDGTVSPAGTCSDWTSTMGMTTIGHSNRTGGGANRTSWNSAHDTPCGAPPAPGGSNAGTVAQGGGRGSIYCFATD
jgi:hypothetical protein